MRGPAPRSLEDRIADKVVPDGDCLLWSGYVNPQTGYGQISLSAANQERLGSHQRIATAPWVMCAIAHGLPPRGLIVLHECDRRLCLAPAHLSWGTQSQNIRAAYERGQQPHGEDHPRAHHSNAVIAEVRRRLAFGESWKAIASVTGVSYSHVWKIARGQRRTYPEVVS